LVTNEADLLRWFTPDETVKTSYSTAFYSALAYLKKSDKLWVSRAVGSGALYAGCTLSTATYDVDGDGTVTPGVSLATGLTDPSTYAFQADELLLIYAANPGAWGNDLSVEVITDQATVKEPNAFIINVYRGGVQVESWTVSRDPNKVDGYGRNIYVETVLEGSLYIRALDNRAVSTSAEMFPEAITTNPRPLASGSDGSAVTDSEMIAALQPFYAKDTYPVTLLMDGGWATAAYHTELLTLAETRQDCFAVLSTPYSAEASSTYLNDIISYKSTTLNHSTSYGALYTPHVKIYDRYNDRSIYVSPDGYVAGIISETASNYEIWYPPAGPRRGQVLVLDVRRRFTPAERDQLYDAGINPIRFVAGKGLTVWGQKTLLDRPSSLDRINVRLLLIVVEEAIRAALEDFLFELNDATTRALVRSLIEAYLSNIKARRGLYDFTVQCDETNNTQQDIDNYRLNVAVYLQPTRSAEFITLNTVITRTGVSFSEVTGGV